jgi:hypothetical protein
MSRSKIGVKISGAAIIFFAVIHLCLNAHIMAAHFTLDSEKVRNFLTAMAHFLGPIAIPEDMGASMFFIKVLASLLFIVSGLGLMSFKEWARRSVLMFLALRLAYGIFICAHYRALHPHLGLILSELILLTYYLTRPAVKAVFGR